jgi:dTDP-4-amino-4,6-dideoxygalactose transaminase
MLKLIPRLNYSFSLEETVFSLIGIFSSKNGNGYLTSLFETEHIYFINHARTGLRILLNSLSLPLNAKIGVQAYNCHTVFNAIHKAGYQPVFIDIDRDFRMDLSDLEKKKKMIDALIVTHTFGIPADMENILRILPGKTIIEDCAHAFLSRINKRIVGKFGDAAIFSMGKGKFPSIGSGGFVVINNKKLIPEFERNFNALQKPERKDEVINIIKSGILNLLHNRYVYRFLTDAVIRKLNKRLDINGNFIHVEEKILRSNLFVYWKKQSDFENYLKNQLNNFTELLKHIYCDNVPSIYTSPMVSVNGFMLPVLRENPEQIITKLRMKGVELGRHFTNSIKWAKQFGYSDGDCPNAETIVNQIIVLPCHYSYPQCGIEIIKNNFK